LDIRHVIAQCAQGKESFYLYDEETILKSIAKLRMAFPEVEFLYAVKCNSNRHVLNCVFRQGFGADAASAGEVLMAHDAGLPCEKIFFSSPGKSERDIRECMGISTLVADSIAEIVRIREAAEWNGRSIKIGIRINPDFSFDGGCGNPSKFGIDEAQAVEFIRTNTCRNVKITGLHIHLKSQELNPEVLSGYYDRVFSLAQKFGRLLGGLEYLDMGAGLGIPYPPGDIPLDLYMVGKTVQRNIDEFRKNYPDTRMIIEVGRYAAGKSRFYVTRVMDRKISHGKTYLLLKNTLNGFIRPSIARLVEQYAPEENPEGMEPLFTSRNAFEFLTLKEEKPSETVTLAGNLCTAADVMAEDIRLPHLDCGDLVIITNAGSYAAVLSPFQFSSHERSEEIFLTKEGKCESTADEAKNVAADGKHQKAGQSLPPKTRPHC